MTVVTPLQQLPIRTILPESGIGFVTYGRVSQGLNQYGTDPCIDMIKLIGQGWHLQYPAFPFAVGDISLRDGAPFHPHADHRRGIEVDIRPFRIDGANKMTDIMQPSYSHVVTSKFVRYLKNYVRVPLIYFNDNKIVAEGLCSFVPGHNDHLHCRLFS